MLDFPFLNVIDDYGPIGRGASQAHSVLAENTSEYIIKGPTFTPNHRHVAANELISARLADLLGLPVLDYRIISLNGDYFFGSSLMPPGTFYPAITPDLFSRCENNDRAYGVVVFDWWIYNVDRHSENLIVRSAGRAPTGPRLLMFLNDHSHAMIHPNEDATVLATRLAAYPPVSLEFVRDSITDPAALSAVIDLVEGLRTDTITEVIATVPPPFLDDPEKQLVIDFLLGRRAQLRQMFNSGRGYFPQLGGGVI
jgi:hypothetical protein